MKMPGRMLWVVTRKHPPAVGGMEALSANLVQELAERRPVHVVRWGRSQRGLPWFLARAAASVMVGLARRRIAALVLGDPVLSILGWPARAAGVPVMCVVHGLDVTWPNRLYQSYLRAFFWQRFDAYLCISAHTAQLVRDGGVAAQRVEVIPVGIRRAPEVPPADLAGDPLLLFIGRLVRRKGASWFVRDVLPRLAAEYPEVRLVVAGDGPDGAPLRAAAQQAGIAAQVVCAGQVSERDKWALLARCDAVIVPNIPVPGDVEGFGIVALEAGAAGKVVFAADLEGLRDAVQDGVNGWRLPAADAVAWTEALKSRLRDRSRLRAQGELARAHVLAHFDWARLGERYANIVERFAPSC